MAYQRVTRETPIALFQERRLFPEERRTVSFVLASGETGF